MSDEKPRERGVMMVCGKCKREQRIVLDGDWFDKDYAIMFAGMMDGTAPIYVHPPKPDRSDCLPGSMGRCGACDGVFTCTIFGFEDPS